MEILHVLFKYCVYYWCIYYYSLIMNGDDNNNEKRHNNIRCKECRKKLNIVNSITSVCRCKNIYCEKHILSHNCSFDYKSLIEKNIKPLHSKQYFVNL